MIDCDEIRGMIVLAASDSLPEARQGELEQHLASCAACREQAAGIDMIHGWLQDQDLFSPEQDYAWQCLPRTLAARAAKERSFRPWLPVNMGFLGWALNIAAVLFLIAGVTYFMRRAQPPPDLTAAAVAPENQAFLGRMQSIYAREVTARYLTDCQDLLLNVMRAERNCQNKEYDVSVEITRARELLERKRLLDSELQIPEIARAKTLCDELESFLVNLSTSDKCESPDKHRRFEQFIQREHLLLRINLVQSEFS